VKILSALFLFSNHPPSVAAVTYGAASEWISAFAEAMARQANFVGL
jgi:hypothetical protein